MRGRIQVAGLVPAGSPEGITRAMLGLLQHAALGGHHPGNVAASAGSPDGRLASHWFHQHNFELYRNEHQYFLAWAAILLSYGVRRQQGQVRLAPGWCAFFWSAEK